MMTALRNMPEIQELLQRGALFVVNHSGGKDSQAMYLRLREWIPPEQLVVMHAALPGVDWYDVVDHIKATIGESRYVQVQSKTSFHEMVEARGMWPSAKYRQCTSKLKREPISQWVREHVREKPNKLVVHCMGMRAQESRNRAGKPTLQLDTRESAAGRTVYTWLPIHALSTEEVFLTIRKAWQKPHWAYAAGMTRLSCMFCIMASKRDLTTAALLRPDALAEIVKLELKIGHTFIAPSAKHGSRTLDQYLGLDIPYLHEPEPEYDEALV